MPGTFNPNVSQNTCPNCGNDGYSGYGAKYCTPCPANSQLIGTSTATSISQCICQNGYFGILNAYNDTCKACPTGGSCTYKERLVVITFKALAEPHYQTFCLDTGDLTLILISFYNVTMLLLVAVPIVPLDTLDENVETASKREVFVTINLDNNVEVRESFGDFINFYRMP
jgi:hypothetical protein